MGHSYREMYPREAEENDRRIERTLVLKERLKDVPLGEIPVGELEAVMRVMGVYHSSTLHNGPRDEHLDLLESRFGTSA